DVELSEHDQVVVAHEADVARLARQLHALVRMRAIAHQIAEAPRLVGAGAVVEHGPEGRKVGVHVGDQGDPQWLPRFGVYSLASMGAHGFRVPLAMVWASAAAGAATVALRPRSGLIDPAPVEVTDYFSAEEIERARAYQRPQRALGLAAMALDGAALAVLALRPPPAIRAALDRAGARPLAGAAATGAAMSLGFGALGLPL